MAATREKISPFELSMRMLKDELFKKDPVMLGVIVAVAVVLITIVIYKLLSRGRGGRNSVLLVGLSGAGKTLLFSRLMYNKDAVTFTSTKENAGSHMTLSKKVVNLVDIPGNIRQRQQYLDQYITQARGLVFVIDSAAFQKEVKEVAEYLYNILSNATFYKMSPKLLIMCNKQDITLSKSAQVIKTQLEKEMNTVRKTKAAALGSTDDSSSSSEIFLGKKDKPFEFSHLSKFKVEFVECSTKPEADEDEPEIGPLQEWLASRL
ncbi:signal recognition particle receptor subunit beta-like isoform X2 [Anneissia japonica]|uniref:signal recognition particle receptor subunit beta-like isoform X1 n=1 Tax=Anneissia japonica TaxID=1529436 RepID=UPI0014259D68|nr:signal recognition particle receptor subunit beta-like isoform X1 [Anneissia japonica]XP_033103894.1 signal recognition particle receptor subunit beta-like isoform X2 [Anneissia japonica]